MARRTHIPYYDSTGMLDIRDYPPCGAGKGSRLSMVPTDIDCKKCKKHVGHFGMNIALPAIGLIMDWLRRTAELGRARP